MDLLILGGNSQSNQAWIQDVAKELKGIFNKRLAYDYQHWLKGQRSLNHQTELKRLADLSGLSDNYAVFAKSAGTVLATEAICQGILSPKKCIFLGLPVAVSRYRQYFVDNLRQLSIPILFMQNIADPVGPASVVKSLLNKSHLQNYQFEATSGANHRYDNFQIMRQLIKNFLSS